MILEFNGNEFRDVSIIKINPEFVTIRTFVENARTYAEFVMDKTADEFRILSTAKSPKIVGIIIIKETIDILFDSNHINEKAINKIMDLSSDYSDNPFFTYGIRSIEIETELTPEHVVVDGEYVVESTIPDMFVHMQGVNTLIDNISNRIKIGESSGGCTFKLEGAPDDVITKYGESIPVVKINNSDAYNEYVAGKLKEDKPNNFNTVYPYELVIFEED